MLELDSHPLPIGMASPSGCPTVCENCKDRLISSSDTMYLDPAHALLLLSDSALPLGSFAYSSGLESYLAHHKPLPASTTPIASFHRFLKLSIASVASTSLPYLLAAYRHPEKLQTLDNDLDASTPCVVAQRVSLAQGRALLGVWERAFRTTYASSVQLAGDTATTAAVKTLAGFSDALKSCADTVNELGPKGTLRPCGVWPVWLWDWIFTRRPISSCSIMRRRSSALPFVRL